MPRHSSYFGSACHPWSCLMFLLPLLVVYEAGIYSMSGGEAEVIRNGADNWLRLLLENMGFQAMYWPPVMIVGIFLIWSWRRRSDRPTDMTGMWLGMAVESVAYAMLMWGMANMSTAEASGSSAPGQSGIALLQMSHDQRMTMILSFVGAGIYEELMFRLMLYPVLRWFLSLSGLLWPIAAGAAMLLSSLAFAGAHHIGPYGEPFHMPVFCFRAAAGMFFALLFQVRGFGIAVGTHTFYDILVGASMS